ncbi:LacI family DNA-binding transcriptional regulator [Pseudomonas putida]|uniref:LacI family DNA-binding transcriptional regulator n=1 Tax=Pseudomonas putida TaxID=303 RepID=UPI0009A1582B|nr:LacI family DNA-binding transcriptional regulator [Pseudomonas putida]
MVSMKDVAREAGVSQPAVSYAYSGSSKISTTQREHIFAVAERLGYPGPSVRGRSLRSGRVGAIGLVVMDQLSYALEDPWAVSLLKGISRVDALANVALTLFPMNSTKLEAQGSDSTLAVRGLVDGLIVSTLPDDHPLVPFIANRQLPLVVVDSPKLPGVNYVGIDDHGAAMVQMNHLLELGHLKIGIIVERLRPDGQTGPVSRERFAASTEMIARERLGGYVEAAEQAGLSFEALRIVEAGGFTQELGERAARGLLGQQEVTAVIAVSDVMALGCLTAARALEYKVPEELSVIGFDDIPDAARFDLTTIRQPLVEKGEWAARVLTQLIEAGPEAEAAREKIFPTRLIVRGTTASPATAA